MGLKLDWEWNGGHGVATAGGLRIVVRNCFHPVTWQIRSGAGLDVEAREVEVIGDDWRAATLTAQEAAEAAASRLLAEDAGVRALMGMDELRARAEKAEIDGECWRLAAQHHYKQFTEADTALTRVVTKLGNAAIRVAELEAALRWIPVTERLPDEGATVLVHSTHRGVMVATYQMDLVRPAFFGHGYAPGTVTHWRPLGAGPAVAANSADSSNLAATAPGEGAE